MLRIIFSLVALALFACASPQPPPPAYPLPDSGLDDVSSHAIRIGRTPEYPVMQMLEIPLNSADFSDRQGLPFTSESLTKQFDRESVFPVMEEDAALEAVMLANREKSPDPYISAAAFAEGIGKINKAYPEFLVADAAWYGYADKMSVNGVELLAVAPGVGRVAPGISIVLGYRKGIEQGGVAYPERVASLCLAAIAVGGYFPEQHACQDLTLVSEEGGVYHFKPNALCR